MEKQDLQRVIEEMRKGSTEAANAEMEKLRRDLEKAQKDVKEGDIERERFQAQLEMLVQELEKKQVGQLMLDGYTNTGSRSLKNIWI